MVNERGLNPSADEWAALKDAVARALQTERPDAGALTGPALDSRPGSLSEHARSASETKRGTLPPGSLSEHARSASETKRGTLPDPAAPLHPVPELVEGPGSTGAPQARQASTPVLVLSGSLPPGAPADLLPSLVRIGRDAGAIVIADTSGPALLAAADAGATVLKPNAAELVEATGIADPLAGACELLRRGVSLVLLSRGADGMLAVTSDEVVRARLATPLAGNPTGAGDAAVAACAVLLAQGEKDPTALLRRATAWSAAAVLMPLAGDIHRSWPDLESALIVDAPALTALG
ncbi:MAG: 1-phosphofructokinase family hexose kinase [Actinobacteria bacterium]|nr:1-phosphofructokinase family hexose kinase [Actinomycetota bacterium]